MINKEAQLKKEKSPEEKIFEEVRRLRSDAPALYSFRHIQKAIYLSIQEERKRVLDVIEEVRIGVKRDLDNDKVRRTEKGIVEGTCDLIRLKIAIQNGDKK